METERTEATAAQKVEIDRLETLALAQRVARQYEEQKAAATVTAATAMVTATATQAGATL